MSRYTIKPNLRTISQIGISAVLGRVPRHMRRSAGRKFANKAWRLLNDYPLLPQDRRVNNTVAQWVVREYEGYRQSQLSNKDTGADSVIDGSAAPTVANELSNGQSNEG